MSEPTSTRTNSSTSAPLTLHERIVAYLVKSYPDNSPGEWAVVTETLDFLLALPVEQRMEAMGMVRRRASWTPASTTVLWEEA